MRNMYFVSFQISTFKNLLTIMINSNKVSTIAICEITLGALFQKRVNTTNSNPNTVGINAVTEAVPVLPVIPK